ncbi:conserved hypothetical protein [Ricinus communis]|uniref:Uncharacterized protein n=1 Tax=Ricinus communis TaxID=3988 RepID=B9TGJ0_RICCO|nr:conserved hypothetical protein [Ricinus communis]
MTNLSQINSIGVAQQWPSRERVIDQIAKTTPWSIEPVTAYNRRDDVENAASAPPHGAYIGVGVRLLADAQAAALKCAPWERAAIDALGYILLGNQLDYFWHVQFRTLFRNHSRPLRMMDWKLIVESMAMLFSLGRREEATYQGYLAYSVLQHSYQLKLSYEKHHRRVHAFMLRLFADWQEGIEYQWLPFANDEPIYEGILERWRKWDPEALKPWLLAACDRHTHESKRETETSVPLRPGCIRRRDARARASRLAGVRPDRRARRSEDARIGVADECVAATPCSVGRGKRCNEASMRVARRSCRFVSGVVLTISADESRTEHL